MSGHAAGGRYMCDVYLESWISAGPGSYFPLQTRTARRPTLIYCPIEGLPSCLKVRSPAWGLLASDSQVHSQNALCYHAKFG